MVAHSLSRAEAIEALELISKYGGVARAARATGQVRETLQARKRRAKQILESEIEEAQSQDPLPIEIIQQPKPRVRVQVGKPEGTQYRVLAIGDAHDAPHIPKDRFYWMGKYAADSGVDWVVQIGDMFSFDSLNSHDANDTLKGKMKDPWRRDVQSAHDALGEFDRGLGSHACKKHETDGNHDGLRPSRYENMHPEIDGMLTSEYDRLLHQYGWSHTPYGEYFFLGGVGFIHAALNRLNKTYGGKNAEATIANDAVFDHVIGHSHVKRDHTAPKLGPSQHVTVLNLGCALPWGHVESYMSHGALTGWWWGCYELAISGGHITDFNAVSMLELERRYAA